MREFLQTWYDAWLREHADTDLIYARYRSSSPSVGLDQVHFVSDRLSCLMWSGVDYDERGVEPSRPDCKATAMVVGEHKSKSVRLPVYSLERPDLGLQIVLRDNYYNWNVSVLSEIPVEADLRGFETDFSSAEERDRYRIRGLWGCCFFEGFPDELRFGPFSMDCRKFSLCVSSDYELYALVRCLMTWRKSVSS